MRSVVVVAIPNLRVCIPSQTPAQVLPHRPGSSPLSHFLFLFAAAPVWDFCHSAPPPSAFQFGSSVGRQYGRQLLVSRRTCVFSRSLCLHFQKPLTGSRAHTGTRPPPSNILRIAEQIVALCIFALVRRFDYVFLCRPLYCFACAESHAVCIPGRCARFGTWHWGPGLLQLPLTRMCHSTSCIGTSCTHSLLSAFRVSFVHPSLCAVSIACLRPRNILPLSAEFVRGFPTCSICSSIMLARTCNLLMTLQCVCLGDNMEFPSLCLYASPFVFIMCASAGIPPSSSRCRSPSNIISPIPGDCVSLVFQSFMVPCMQLRPHHCFLINGGRRSPGRELPVSIDTGAFRTGR